VTAPLSALAEIVGGRRCVLVAGMPGVGKSRLVRSLAAAAEADGHDVHLLQWDVARLEFDRPDVLARFPEVDGVTHLAIRFAAGAWARDALARWERTVDERGLLVGETPLAGQRFVELAQRRDDEIEPLLAGERTLFVIPAPTREVRAHIEAQRSRDVTEARDRSSAPTHLVDAHWAEVAEIAARLGPARLGRAPQVPTSYDPDAYVAVYRHALRHRRVHVLPIDALVAGPAPATRARDLVPGRDEVDRYLARFAERSRAELDAIAARWYEA